MDEYLHRLETMIRQEKREYFKNKTKTREEAITIKCNYDSHNKHYGCPYQNICELKL